jgi:hypothetical protein
MSCRYTRDQLIYHALKQAQLPNLEVHDMPDGVVLQDAYMIQWLQEILDYWYHHCPFQMTVSRLTLNCVPQSNHLILPEDFMIDVRDGYLVQTIPGDSQTLKRTKRTSFQKLLNRELSNQKLDKVNFPEFYCIIGSNNDPIHPQQIMEVAPVPSIATQGILCYYKRPASLEAHHRPSLPDDHCAIEYLRIRAYEFVGMQGVPIGSAKKYCGQLLGEWKAAGLLSEPEDDEIPMDTQVYRNIGGGYMHPYNWMGQR